MPPDPLAMFAELFEERPDLRPMYRGFPLHFTDAVAWILPIYNSGGVAVQKKSVYIDLELALAHCIAHLAKVVAKGGWVVTDRFDGTFYYGLMEDCWEPKRAPTYEEALCAAARETKAQ